MTAGFEPACWSWNVPPERTREQEIDRMLAEQVGKPLESRYERCHIELILDGDPSVGRMSLFHQQRCAICGLRPVDGHLVDDHCHESGQIRGWLCRSCNVREGVSRGSLYVRYRRLHPAAILGVYEPCTGIGWNDGWSLVEHGRDAYRFGPRPRTEWPAWSRESARDVG